MEDQLNCQLTVAQEEAAWIVVGINNNKILIK